MKLIIFKVANLVLDDFRKVKLGRITLETVEDIEKFEEDNGNQRRIGEYLQKI